MAESASSEMVPGSPRARDPAICGPGWCKESYL